MEEFHAAMIEGFSSVAEKRLSWRLTSVGGGISFPVGKTA